jgi:hypothetical protein
MSLEQAVQSFRSEVESNYELDAEFVDALCDFFKKAALSACPTGGSAPAAETKASKPRAPRKAKAVVAPTPVAETPVTEQVSEPAAASPEQEQKQKRKKSAYNVYVREMMQHPDISSLNHKEKMVAIAARWKGMSDEDRALYATKAASE